MKFTSKKTIFLMILLMVFPLLISLLSGLSVSSQIISPSNATTSSTLTCSWIPSSDTIVQNVTWFNGSSVYSNDNNISFNYNSSSISSYTARKNEIWTCQVSLSNGTTVISNNQSITISNSAPNAPNATNQTLYEDQFSQKNLFSQDPDEDTVYYSIINNDFSPFFCSIGLLSGQLNCSPESNHIGNTSIKFIADDGELISGTIVNYNIISVNDPPSFSIPDQSAIEDVLFNISFNATDEENNFPINFSMSSDITNLILVQNNNNSAYITFDRASHAPIFAEGGYWLVVVNGTDNGSDNSTPFDNNFFSTSFHINISTVNQAPNITSNLSDISGSQNSLLTFYVNASDLDLDNNLTFDISSNCSISNPWVISTINNSYNATGLVNMTLSNSHVICRYVNISVSDGQESDFEEFFINISNLNDAPVIYNVSYNNNNSGGNNISYLSAVKGGNFKYTINASDIDSLTYENEVLFFTDNTSLFNINSSTGVIEFVPLEADVANHSILINVSDDEGLWDSQIMFLSVLNNTPPSINQLTNVSCYEDVLCNQFVSAYDPDSGENLTFTSNESLFSISYFNESSYVHSVIHDNNDVGSYLVNVSVVDNFGFLDWNNFSFHIINTNDAPFFDQNNDGSADNVSFGVVVENHTTTIRVNVTDDDFVHGLENLSYSWAFVNDSNNLSSNFSFTTQASNYFVLSFTPNSSQLGNYIVNLSVVDSSNASYWQNVSFTVLNKTSNPSINQIRPYRISATNSTVFSFDLASNYPSKNITVYSDENSNIIFDALATNDSGISNNYLNYYWFIDGSLNQTVLDANPGSNSALNYNFNYFSAGSHSVRLVVEDLRFSNNSWSWNAVITNVNRAPVLSGSLENISVNSTVSINDYFSYRSGTQRFYDPDDDSNSDGFRGSIYNEGTNLTYSRDTNFSSCSYVSFSYSGDTINLVPQEVGTCLVRFVATDPDGESVTSNTVRITVTDVEIVEVETTTSSSGGGSNRIPRLVPLMVEEPVDKPHPLELVVPEKVITYSNGTIKIPIVLNNPWNDSLIGISLNASSSVNLSYNISFKFEERFFSEILPHTNISTSLIVKGYRLEEPYDVIIKALVIEPDFSDTARVLINSLERLDSGDNVESKINFARDLLNDNPECQELSELLDKAERARNDRESDKALKFINAAVNGCKFLINEEKDPVIEKPLDFYSVWQVVKGNGVIAIIGGIILLILLIFSVIMIFSGRNKTDKENKDI